MPQNGYWIECIPVSGENCDQIDNTLYSAEIASIPEAKVFATTPDKAIQALRDKLKALRHDYCMRGKDLPEHDSPVSPPRNMCSVKGWISVYVQMSDCCRNL